MPNYVKDFCPRCYQKPDPSSTNGFKRSSIYDFSQPAKVFLSCSEIITHMEAGSDDLMRCSKLASISGAIKTSLPTEEISISGIFWTKNMKSSASMGTKA